MDKISIGNRVLVSYNVSIFDNNGHPLDAAQRHLHYKHEVGDDGVVTAPVIIEDDVWVGCNSVILKGVRIGKGSIIGAGSIVTANIPPMSLVAGNPAQVIKPLS